MRTKLTEKGIGLNHFLSPIGLRISFYRIMYTCHLGVYRKKIVDEIGGFRKGYEGSQDYDLVLRFIEKTDRHNIFHLPKILYHWRTIAGSTAGSQTVKKYAYVAAKRALTDHLERNNIEGEVLDANIPGELLCKEKDYRKSKSFDHHSLQRPKQCSQNLSN